MSHILSDEELWQSTTNGDHQAFSAIVNRYNSKLYLFIKNRTGSEEDAKDILQDILISLWNNRQKTVLRTSLVSYLYGAARYAIIDWQIASKKPVKSIELLTDENLLKSQVHSVESHIIAAEFRDEIFELIDRLPESVRTVFRMSRIEQKNNKEIARELQLSDKTVRNNLSLALNFLRKHLGKSMGMLILAVILKRVFLW